MSESYEQVQYESYPFAETHIRHLFAIANSFGIKAAMPDACRVLEIGCASGGNIIPMAFHFPESTFVGIDISESHIREAKDFANTLSLKNISFEAASFESCQSDSLDAKFDYIICHGLYTWISSDLQRELLRLCKKRLTSEGVAYISYNTLPGWYLRLPLRELMQHHSRDAKTSEERLTMGREVLRKFTEVNSQIESSFAFTLEQTTNMLERAPDWYVFHEYLEDENTPILFRDFVSRLENSGLAYVADADLSIMFDLGLPKQIESLVEGLPLASVEREQYVDFFRNRSLRRSIVAHDDIDVSVVLERENLSEFFSSYRVASPAVPKNPKMVISSNASEDFVIPERGTFTLSPPILKAGFLTLANAWPLGVEYSTLVDTALGNVSPSRSYSNEEEKLYAEVLANGLWEMFLKGVVKIEQESPACVATITEKPMANLLVRKEAERRPRVTTARHEFIVLDEFSRHLIPLLNGERTLDELFSEIKKKKVQVFNPMGEGKERLVALDTMKKEAFIEWCTKVLRELARRGVLSG